MDPYGIRDDFPIFRRKVNDHPLIYFDNAATTQKPNQVISSVTDFYENHNANVHRAVHTLSQEATEMHEAARERIATFLGAKESAEVVFVRGTTEAVNLVAYAWGLHNLNAGDEVLLSLMEHHSNIVPWEIVSQMRGFKVNYSKVNSDGTLDYADLENKVSNKTKIVCLSHVSNVSGVINDVQRVAKIAHDNDALMLVDGAQSVPHMPVNVQDLDLDFLAFSGHKMLGPTGIGCLYGKRNLLDKMPPFQGGGEMIREVSFDTASDRCGITWNDPPWKFEAGTPDISGSIALGEAVKYLSKIGMGEVFDHEVALMRQTMKLLENHGNVKVYGPTNISSKCGIIPFSVDGLSSHDVALFLDSYGITIRSGFHCAQPLHQVFKLQSSARASFYIYNTIEEVKKFGEVLEEIEKL